MKMNNKTYQATSLILNFFKYVSVKGVLLEDIYQLINVFEIGYKLDDFIKWKHFRVTFPLWREFTGDRWIPLTNASDAELWCFLWSVPEQMGE